MPGARSSDDASGALALGELCQSYWQPLYAYVGWQGFDPHEAQDLTQEFFARLLDKHFLAAADREAGRFRTFLLMAVKRFLAKDLEATLAQKRGGGRHAVTGRNLSGSGTSRSRRRWRTDGHG